METKTIRFEKGEYYTLYSIQKHFIKDINKYFHYNYNNGWYICIKSFTVQINIIEDERMTATT
jgi:hypothetical protein